MFLPSDQLERSALRQGDVVGPIHIVGAIDLLTIQYTQNVEGTRGTGWTIPTKAEFQNAMILSHSCEMDISNGVKVTSFILAPIRDASAATNPALIEQLRSSNLINENTGASFLKYFYLEPRAEFADENMNVSEIGYCVDFSKCFSVRKGCHGHLLQKKKLQMAPDITQAMATKLALYFYRRQVPNQAIAHPA